MHQCKLTPVKVIIALALTPKIPQEQKEKQDEIEGLTRELRRWSQRAKEAMKTATHADGRVLVAKRKLEELSPGMANVVLNNMQAGDSSMDPVADSSTQMPMEDAWKSFEQG